MIFDHSLCKNVLKGGGVRVGFTPSHRPYMFFFFSLPCYGNLLSFTLKNQVILTQISPSCSLTNMNSPRYTTLILDLGDVLFSWSATTKTNISSKTLISILSSPPWLEYECGCITQEVCYDRVGERFCLQPSGVAEAFSQARKSLQSNRTMISLIHNLKKASNGKLHVYAMSNISKPDYIFLKETSADWSVFDEVFTSCEVGMRKPSLSFYRHVLEVTHKSPQEAIFVDDKFENVFAARSLGLHGILFDNNANVSQTLWQLLSNPRLTGMEFLMDNAQQLHSVTDTNVVIRDNYAQLLILEATNIEYNPSPPVPVPVFENSSSL